MILRLLLGFDYKSKYFHDCSLHRSSFHHPRSSTHTPSTTATMTSTTASKTTPTGSPRNSSSLDEGLPLYEELQYSDHHDDALPHATATPTEVAHFLLQLLVLTEAMSLDQGRRVAARWTKGTGQELLSYPPMMFFEIFGTEDGWIVYRETKMAVHVERMQGFWYKYGACKYHHPQHCERENTANEDTDVWLALLSCLVVVATVIFFSAANETLDAVAPSVMIYGGFGVFGLSVFLCVRSYRGRKKMIEGSLASELHTAVLKRATTPAHA
jgi:hypothetical protein